MARVGKDRHRQNAAKGLPYVQLYHWLRATPAWRSLGPYARCLYVEMRGRYNGSNNGNIVMSYREAQELLGCSNKPIPGAFLELQDRGFVKPNKKGSFSWKMRFNGAGRATTWILTELRQDFPETVLTPSIARSLLGMPAKRAKNESPAVETVPNVRCGRRTSDSRFHSAETIAIRRRYGIHDG